MSDPVILFDIDPETPVSIQGDVVRADWYDAGEGLCGDYNPDNPHDIHLLRFDIYVRDYDDKWKEVEDASYCTRVAAAENRDVLAKALRYIYDRYDEVLSCDVETSVKKLGEHLSWITV